jgi:hypothetical protein
MSAKIRILIADDHTDVREGLASIQINNARRKNAQT